MSINVTALGSGSRGNAFVFGCKGLNIMVDAGFSRKELLRRMEIAGIKPESIQAVLVTHEHDDHVKGIKVFCDTMNIPVCLSAGTANYLKQKQKLPARFKIFSPGDSFLLCGFNIKTFPVMHDAVEPVGFVISNGESKIGMATDLGIVSRNVVEAMTGCNTIVWESNYDLEMLKNSNRTYNLKRRILSASGHLNNRDAAEALAKLVTAETRSVILAHVSRECNTYSIAAQECARIIGLMGRNDIKIHVAIQDEPLIVQENAPRGEYNPDLLAWANCDVS